jgi:hypothetical protein
MVNDHARRRVLRQHTLVNFAKRELALVRHRRHIEVLMAHRWISGHGGCESPARQGLRLIDEVLLSTAVKMLEVRSADSELPRNR